MEEYRNESPQGQAGSAGSLPAPPFSDGKYSGRELNSDEGLSLSSPRPLLNSITIDILAHVADTEMLLGEPRQKGTSHRIYRTPWPDDPRVNIQNVKGMAKPYQARQVIKAIEKLEGMK